MKILRSCLTLACLAGALCGAAVAAPPRLSIVDLSGISDAESSTLVDINNHGAGIGWAQDGFMTRPFLYSPSTGVQDFGTLVGAAPTASLSLFDINDRGQVVGEWDGRAFQYASATGVEFLSSGEPGASGAALRINEAGQVALRHHGGSFLYTPGQGEMPLPLSLNGGGSLNNAGATAGIALPDPSDYSVGHAARSDAQGNLTDLGTLGGSNSYANDLNDAGDVVGYSWLPGNVPGTLPFRALAGGVMAPLDLGSFDATGWIVAASTISNDGLITGFYYPDDLSGPSSAFLYHDRFGFVDANALLDAEDAAAWRIVQVGRFNDAGYATIFGSLNGQGRAALVHFSTPVPEPGLALLLAVALPLVGRGLARRQARDAFEDPGRAA
ncbi:hypothetical protein [Rhizobacter sp. LjRoot28]|uniref:hypothetical protein n=1 Tax=Rhizobacter sp. LjRoot28 TaxID=3342309 RepID=UPI003ECD9B3B